MTLASEADGVERVVNNLTIVPVDTPASRSQAGIPSTKAHAGREAGGEGRRSKTKRPQRRKRRARAQPRPRSRCWHFWISFAAARPLIARP